MCVCIWVCVNREEWELMSPFWSPRAHRLVLLDSSSSEQKVYVFSLNIHFGLGRRRVWILDWNRYLYCVIYSLVVRFVYSLAVRLVYVCMKVIVYRRDCDLCSCVSLCLVVWCLKAVRPCKGIRQLRRTTWSPSMVSNAYLCVSNTQKRYIMAQST